MSWWRLATRAWATKRGRRTPENGGALPRGKTFSGGWMLCFNPRSGLICQADYVSIGETPKHFDFDLLTDEHGTTRDNRKSKLFGCLSQRRMWNTSRLLLPLVERICWFYPRLYLIGFNPIAGRKWQAACFFLTIWCISGSQEWDGNFKHHLMLLRCPTNYRWHTASFKQVCPCLIGGGDV